MSRGAGRWGRGHAVAAAFALAVALAAGVRIWNALYGPLMWGYDAWGHVAYVLFLDLYGAVPYADQGWSYYQPPLHYALGALLAGFGDGELLVRGLSLLGGAASLGIAGLAAWLAHRELPRRPELALVAFGAVAFLPVHLTVGNMPGNEMTVAFLNAAAIALLVANEDRESPALSLDLALGAVLGLAALAKHTGFVAWLAVGASLVVRAWLASPRDVALRRLPLRGGAIAAAAVLVAGPHYARNLESYGALIPSNRDYALVASVEAEQPPGERRPGDYLRLPPAVLAHPDPLDPAMLRSVWGSLYANVWSDTHRESEVGRRLEVQGRIGPAVLVPIWLGLLPTALALAGAVGAARDVVRGRRRALYVPLLALSLVMLGAFAVFVWIVPRWAAVKASYCLSLSLPFALFLVRGLEMLWAAGPRPLRVAAAVWLVATAAVTAAVGTAGLVRPRRQDAPAAGAVHFYFGEYEAARRIQARLAERTRYPAPWYENMAAVDLARGEAERARALYRTAIRLAEARGLDDPRRVARLAAASAVAGDLEAAREGLDAALAEGAGADVLANRGAVALAAGDLEAARRDLERAVAEEPWLDVAWRHLALARERAGDLAGARAARDGARRAACLAPRGYPYGVGTGEILEWGIGRRWVLRLENGRLVPRLPADWRARCAAAEAGR